MKAVCYQTMSYNDGQEIVRILVSITKASKRK